MADVTQLSDDATLEDDEVLLDTYIQCIIAGADPDRYRTELLRRLALRDQQVTLAMAQESLKNFVASFYDDDDYTSHRIFLDDALNALAQLPWPHGSGVDGE